MKIPAHLKHKPIIQVENYDRLDGPYADNTDAMGLSVGIAQWNGRVGQSFQPKYGGTLEKNGHASLKNSPFTGLSI